MINVQIYRYHPEHDATPYMQSKTLPEEFRSRMVLDALEYLRAEDSTLAYRRSCREGVCGSDGMNINGKNWLACIKPIAAATAMTPRLISTIDVFCFVSGSGSRNRSALSIRMRNSSMCYPAIFIFAFSFIAHYTRPVQRLLEYKVRQPV